MLLFFLFSSWELKRGSKIREKFFYAFNIPFSFYCTDLKVCFFCCQKTNEAGELMGRTGRDREANKFCKNCVASTFMNKVCFPPLFHSTFGEHNARECSNIWPQKWANMWLMLLWKAVREVKVLIDRLKGLLIDCKISMKEWRGVQVNSLKLF